MSTLTVILLVVAVVLLLAAFLSLYLTNVTARRGRTSPWVLRLTIAALVVGIAAGLSML